MNVFGVKKKSRTLLIIPKNWCSLNQFIWSPQRQSHLLVNKSCIAALVCFSPLSYTWIQVLVPPLLAQWLWVRDLLWSAYFLFTKMWKIIVLLQRTDIKIRWDKSWKAFGRMTLKGVFSKYSVSGSYCSSCMFCFILLPVGHFHPIYLWKNWTGVTWGLSAARTTRSWTPELWALCFFCSILLYTFPWP